MGKAGPQSGCFLIAIARMQLSWRVATISCACFFHRCGFLLLLKNRRMVAPSNQAWLRFDRQDLVGGTDQYGNLYFTLGAGTAEGDTSASSNGVLINGTNRQADVNFLDKRSSSELPIPKDFLTEGSAIIQLLSAHDRYTNNLPYFCFPETVSGAYNSNWYAHGLLHAARLSHSERLPSWRPTPGCNRLRIAIRTRDHRGRGARRPQAARADDVSHLRPESGC